MPAGLESEFAPNSLRIIGFHRMNTKSAVRMTGALKKERKQPEKKNRRNLRCGEGIMGMMPDLDSRCAGDWFPDRSTRTKG